MYKNGVIECVYEDSYDPKLNWMEDTSIWTIWIAIINKDLKVMDMYT